MRLASYRLNGVTSYGAVVGGRDLDDLENARIVDIPRNVPGAPSTITDFLAARPESGLPVPDGPSVTFGEVELLPVIPEPRNIICIGVNYVDHASETGASVPEYPVIFSKFTSSISAHGAPIVIPEDSTQPDFEAELGLVIGAPASRVPVGEALQAVAGYFTFDDVSARDYQNRTGQWTQGKGFPTFAPTGPYLVTSDEFGDPAGRRIRLTLADRVMQEATTSDMIFTVPQIVSYVSSVCDLRPGDIIATGTPSGIGAAHTPPRFLRPGDRPTVTIDGLPTLWNPVVAHG